MVDRAADAESRPTGRRCAPRPRTEGELRPTDLVGAFFVLGLGFLLAGAGVGAFNALDPWPDGRWLALHLAFVGGVSQLVLGASQFFAGAFLATDPPPRRLVRAQIAAWNLGSVGIAVAVPVGADLLTDASVLALLAGLALYGGGLARIRRGSLTQAPWATRWYLAGAAFFAVGIVAGAALAKPVIWTHGNLLSAHLALNLAGWFGAAIVGTLHTFLPSLAKTTLRFPRLQLPTFAAWTLGVAALAAGYAFGLDGLAIAGWMSLSAAALLLAANVAGCFLSAAEPLSLPARIVATAQVFLVAGVAVATVAALGDGAAYALAGDTRGAVAVLLVVGWIGLTVLGSLIHLLAVVVRVRDLGQPMPLPDPRWGPPVAVSVALGIVGLAVAELTGLDSIAPLATAAVLACYALLGAWVVGLGYMIIARARPRI